MGKKHKQAKKARKEQVKQGRKARKATYLVYHPLTWPLGKARPEGVNQLGWLANTADA